VVGENIDHYKLLAVAGRGGMGVVYKALDQSLDRVVALKVLRRDRLGDEALGKLAEEASVTASIHHPHVVNVFTTGMDQGRFYIAMELVEQGTLDDLIRLQGRVAETQVLEVAIQVAEGLRAAYQAGLIHRDVKPGNILFADSHTTKIVDFGLAMAERAAAEAVGSEIWGTPYYVAPEKLDQQPEDLRSDIYSLGATLFHALAGRPPFEAPDASMVALKHLKNQAVSLQAFAPWVSGSTAYIVNRTLHKDPNERYQSYDELIEHLEYARNEVLGAGRKPKEKQRVVLEDAGQQRLWAGLTIGMVAVALVAGLIFFFSAGKTRTAFHPGATSAEATASVSLFPQTPEFKSAVTILESGDYPKAAAAFRHIRESGSCPQLLLQWALLHEGLAEFLADDGSKARMAFHLLSNRPYMDATPEAQHLGQFFSNVAADAEGANLVSVAGLHFDNTTYETLGLLVAALKNWQLGGYEEAAPIFREIRLAKVPRDCPWIGDLQAAVNPMLDSYMQFKVARDRYQNAADADARSAAASDLRGSDHTFARLVKEMLPSNSLADDFNNWDAAKWKTYGGTWTAAAGLYTVDAGEGNKAIAGEKSYSDFDYEADVLVGAEGGNAGLMFRVSNPAVGGDAYNGYFAGIETNRLILGKAANNWTELAAVSMPLAPNKFYHLRIVASGENIKVYADDMTKARIDINDSTYASGVLGIRTMRVPAKFSGISAETLAYRDSFASKKTSDWRTYEGAWSVAEGSYSVNSGSGFKAVLSDRNFSNFTYDANVSFNGGGGNAGLIFRVSNPGIGMDAYVGYYVGISPGEVLLGKADHNWTSISSVPVTLAQNVPHHVRVTAVGPNIRIYVDDVQVPKISATDASFASGNVGFRTFNLPARFSEITILQ